MSARPTSSTSSTATQTKELFRDIFRARQWRQELAVQPVEPVPRLPRRQPGPITARRGAIPTRTVFGWQKPCYLLGEGYAKTFKELMEDTDWDKYGTGNYEKCADCMVHCGFEATAVDRRGPASREGARGRVARRQDRRADGAGHLARQPAAGRIRLLRHVEREAQIEIRKARPIRSAAAAKNRAVHSALELVA